MVAAVTQTYSVIIIVLEITGQMVLVKPLIISITIAIAIVKNLALSIYTVAAKIKGLAMLDELRFWNYEETVQTVMTRQYPFLTQRMKVSDIDLILKQKEAAGMELFPIIKSHGNQIFLYQSLTFNRQFEIISQNHILQRQ